MDEKTVRVVLQVPEDMMRFLERLAARRQLNTRAVTKAIRFCIQEEMKREAKGTGGPSKIEDFRALL